jgi:hypothetical protein
LLIFRLKNKILDEISQSKIYSQGKMIKIDQNLTRIISLNELESDLKVYSIRKGGKWSPKECRTKSRVALIIPYRNREENLVAFLRHLHSFLNRQMIDYGIFLVEPVNNLTFNRGILMNIGFIESLKLNNNDWDCFIFHDVDMVRNFCMNFVK